MQEFELEEDFSAALKCTATDTVQPVAGPHLLDGARGVQGQLVVGGYRPSGGQDLLEGPGFDRQSAPPCNHRSVRIQGLREPLAPEQEL